VKTQGVAGKKGISIPVVGVVFFVAIGAGYIAGDAFPIGTHKSTDTTDQVATIHQVRRQDFEFARPLLLADVRTQDVRLNSIKDAIGGYVESRKQSGALINASVYLRVLNTGAWFSVNGNESYSPGSLLKVALLIEYLRESERDPSLFSKAVRFDKKHDLARRATIVEKELEPGKNYTVEELLQYMIKYSDNEATVLLNSLLPNLDQIYADLDLPRLEKGASDYFLTSEQYGKFFRVLYNATYLTAPHSDYALRLLSESAFKDGLTKSLPPTLKVPRKFGEREINGEKQFHEFGIVYLNGSPYLIGVMTKGKDMNDLETSVSDISTIVYNTLGKSTPAL
jgi:beta-lactamase class A